MEVGKDKGKTNLYRLDRSRFTLSKVVHSELPCSDKVVHGELPPSSQGTTPSSTVNYPVVHGELHKYKEKEIIKDTKKESKSPMQKPASVKSVISGEYQKNPENKTKTTVMALIHTYRTFIETEHGVPAKLTQKDNTFFYAYRKKFKDIEINCNEVLLYVLKNWGDFKYYLLKLTGEQCGFIIPPMAFIAKSVEYILPWMEKHQKSPPKKLKPNVVFVKSLDVPLEIEKQGFKSNVESMSTEDYIKQQQLEILALEEEDNKNG